MSKTRISYYIFSTLSFFLFMTIILSLSNAIDRMSIQIDILEDTIETVQHTIDSHQGQIDDIVYDIELRHPFTTK